MNYISNTDQYINTKELANRLNKSSTELRRILVARNVLWHNKMKKRYELTNEAVRQGLGKVRTHSYGYGNATKHYLLSETAISNFLITTEVLPEPSIVPEYVTDFFN